VTPAAADTDIPTIVDKPPRCDKVITLVPGAAVLMLNEPPVVARSTTLSISTLAAMLVPMLTIGELIVNTGSVIGADVAISF